MSEKKSANSDDMLLLSDTNYDNYLAVLLCISLLGRHFVEKLWRSKKRGI